MEEEVQNEILGILFWSSSKEFWFSQNSFSHFIMYGGMTVSLSHAMEHV